RKGARRDTTHTNVEPLPTIRSWPSVPIPRKSSRPGFAPAAPTRATGSSRS
ncbi:MAG: hypothetical protein, partial [Olavius algarvensis Gamma 1 endosymbiont]